MGQASTRLLVIRRDSHEENTFAVVRWSGCSVDRFKETLKAAVTDWIEIGSGKEAWEDSSGDFNVGDLANWTGNADLIFILAQYGIMDLDIDVFSDESMPDWTFDEVLNLKQ